MTHLGGLEQETGQATADIQEGRLVWQRKHVRPHGWRPWHEQMRSQGVGVLANVTDAAPQQPAAHGRGTEDGSHAGTTLQSPTGQQRKETL